MNAKELREISERKQRFINEEVKTHLSKVFDNGMKEVVSAASKGYYHTRFHFSIKSFSKLDYDKQEDFIVELTSLYKKKGLIVKDWCVSVDEIILHLSWKETTFDILSSIIEIFWVKLFKKK